MSLSTVITGCMLVYAGTAIGAENDVSHIAGGTFTMGTDAADIADLKKRYDVDFPDVFENESPAHEVTLSDFGIDRFEVTNERYADFIDENAEWHPEHLSHTLQNGDYLKHWQHGQYPEELARHPVVFVTWHAAQSYCRWRGGRLPTEAEWEYAASSGGSREFPWGEALPSPHRANYSASSENTTTPVGTYPPNDADVYDLAGNVWEFLYDEWRPNYSIAAHTNPIAGGLVPDDGLVAIRGRRAVRGASFGGSVVNLRTRWRDSHVVDNAIGFVGFRCAYSDQY